MSNTYLEKYRSSLSQSQGNQILKLLTTKKDSGEIKNLNEFKDKLKELTTKILTERITPTLQLYSAVEGEDISSQQYNEMLDRIRDDLETSFTEADNLDTIIAAHHNLINNVALKALRYGIKELETKISLYEFINKNSHGLDDALFNTFSESSNIGTNRADSNAALVFIDPRKAESIDLSYDSAVDTIGERLILGAESNQYLTIKEAIWLSNANSIRSELDVEFKDSKISNIIDGQVNTFWVVPLLRRTIESAPMELALYTATLSDINYIEIEPAVLYPMELIGLDYIDGSGSRQSIGNTDLTLDGTKRINFEKVSAKAIILRLRQDNYEEIQFTQKLGESNLHRAVLGESLDTIDMASINEDLKEVLSSDFILTDVMGVTSADNTSLKYYQYTLGFDNIRLGFSLFRDLGIFVSKKKTVEDLGQIALRVDETRPVQNAGTTAITLEDFTYPVRSSTEDSKFYHGVVEYWGILKQFGEDGYLISVDAIPLLPLGAERVYHEQLIFTFTHTGSQNPDVARLMFYTEADSNDVLVYRNGTLLTYSTDWAFVATGTENDATIDIPGSGKPMKRAIRILSAVELLDIYTVSYTPTLSNTCTLPVDTTLLKIVDLAGDKTIRLAPDNITVLDTLRYSYKVKSVDIYLIIIMRKNSADHNYSPAVEEYLLATGSKDIEKFSGD